MSDFIVRHPIFSLDREISIESGVGVTHGFLEELVANYSPLVGRERSFLQHNTVRNDLKSLVERDSYKIVYAKDGCLPGLFADLESVYMPECALTALDYFKTNDPYSYNHFLSVFALSTLLAKDLMPDYREILSLAATGPTHDIGKLCVPLEILNKRAPLTKGEKDMLDNHTFAGYVLMSCYTGEVNSLSACVARDHHERNNGKGRPRGIELRNQMTEIIAVCDVFDALISPRPYRPSSFDNRTALEEIVDLGNKNEFGWDVIKALVSYNRSDKPHYEQVVISPERRGVAPAGNSHGIIAEEAVPQG